VAHQTVHNLDLIPATVVDTSNDASLVQMTKQASMAMNCIPDSSQVVKTCVDGGDQNQNTSGGSAYNDKLQTLKHVGNPQQSGMDVVSDMFSVELSMCTPLMEQTAENHLEVYSSPHKEVVDHMTLETDSDGCSPEERLKCPRKSLFPEPISCNNKYRLPELVPRPRYKLPKRWMFSTYNSNTKWDAPFRHNMSTLCMTGLHC
jgi:hypothetical protein